MFDPTDKRRAYWLIDKYLNKYIDTLTFKDEYYHCYFPIMEKGSLLDIEETVFSELLEISERFSEFESDHLKYPGLYYTEEEVRQKAIEVKKKLADYWPKELQD